MFVSIAGTPLTHASSPVSPPVSSPQEYNPDGYLQYFVDLHSGEVYTNESLPYYYYPIGAAFDSANQRMYVLEEFGTILVIDTTTNQSLPELNLPSAPYFAIAYDSQNNELYVAADNGSSAIGQGSVLALDPSTGQILDDIPTIAEPTSMALDTANGELFVGGAYLYSGVGVIDTSDNEALPSINATGSFDSGAVFDPTNGDVYFPNQGQTVVVIDGATDTLATPINVTSSQDQAVYDPANDEVYFATFVLGDKTGIIAVDSSNSIVANFTFSPPFVTMFTDPQSGKLFLVGFTGYLNENVSAISPATNRIVDSFNTTTPILFSQYDSTNGQFYLLLPYQYVTEFNPQESVLAGAVPLFADPSVIAYDAHDEGVYVYSTLAGTNASVVNLVVNQTVVSTTPLGVANLSADVQMVASSKTGLDYVSMGNGSVFVVNGTASKVVSRFETATPSAMVYDSNDNSLYLLQPASTSTRILDMDLSTQSNSSQTFGFQATTMVLDAVDDQLIVGGAAGGGITLVDPSNLSPVESFQVGTELGGEISSLAYDSGDNLIYTSNGANLFAVSASSGEVLYQSSLAYYELPVSGLQYDPSDGFVYVLVPQGYVVVLGSADYVMGSLQTVDGFYGAAGMAYDPADGYLYVGNQLIGGVDITQPAPPLPVTQTSGSTTTETLTTTESVTTTATTTTTVSQPPTTTTVTSTQTQTATQTATETATQTETQVTTQTVSLTTTSTATSTATLTSTSVTTATASATSTSGTGSSLPLTVGLVAGGLILGAGVGLGAARYTGRKSRPT